MESSAIILKKALNDLAIARLPFFASGPPVTVGVSTSMVVDADRVDTRVAGEVATCGATVVWSPEALINGNFLEYEVEASVGTELACPDDVALGVSLFLASECNDFEGNGGVVGEDAGLAVESGFGGSVLAELMALAGGVAASGLLPTAGTEPTCFAGAASGAPLSFATECEDFGGGRREDDEDGGSAVDRGFGGSVLAVLSSLAFIDAASGPLPSAGTEPTCFDV